MRHGARAPLKNADPHKFKVPTGMLTASGMRHRMMLGMFNRQRYVLDENQGLLDAEYNPNQIYVQSTTSIRAIQSGYSELMGLYPPKRKSEILNEPALQNKTLPPMKLRSILMNSGLETTYVPIPIYNFLDDNDRD